MNIFGRKREKQPPQLEVTVPERRFGGKNSYDVRAALAKALLLFMLSFGAVGGFLSAYDMDYNRKVCALCLAGMALLLGFLYETKVRSFTNLIMIVIFLIYAYMAVTRFWILNSGAYAVINKMYEVARTYLGVNDASQYSLRIEDTHLTVTAIAIFVGVVGIILVAIRTQYSASFLRIFLMTFTLYLIPFYFDKVPDRLSTFFLLSSYSTLLIVQCSGSRKEISGQIRRVLPVGIAISAVVVVLSGVLIPQNRYRLWVPKNPQKKLTEEAAVVYAQFGMLAILENTATGGGVSGGMLSENAAVMPKYKTDLLVRYAPYSIETTYLRAFAGVDYLGDCWLDIDYVFPQETSMEAAAAARREAFEEHPERQGRGIMEVVNLDANQEFDYRPYYTESASDVQMGNDAFYTYYPAVGNVIVSGEAPDDKYLYVPPECYRAVEETCLKAGFSGSPEEIAQEIVDYFDENFSYTLRPGFHFGTQDYISYFLQKNKKGYCAHFASAGVMLFRYMGIPARYVEGYAFSYTDMVMDGELLEEGSYGDYYSGYSPIGETAPLEVKISDDQAHAWIEIYLDGKGWVVVDPTPAMTEEEDVGSFWENFGLNGGNGNALNQTDGGITDYLEDALAGSAFYVLLFFVAAVLFVFGKKVFVRWRERNLPIRERVRLEYRRLTDLVSRREPEFAVLTTPAQEIAWLREVYGIEFSEGFSDRIYGLFFAPNADPNVEDLRRELVKIRGKVFRTRRRK